MNLEKLVPPLELCRMIPAGEFEDSAFVWEEASNYETDKLIYEKVKHRVPAFELKHYWNLKEKVIYHFYPAPTLQEILLDLPNWSDLTVDFVNPQISLRIKGKDMKLNPSPAAEALKLWLAVKEEQGK